MQHEAIMEKQTPAYFIFDVKINDPQLLKPYQEKVEASYKLYGGTLLILGGNTETFECKEPEGIFVMLRFDSQERAKAWYNSPEYQEIIHHRHAAAKTHAWLVEGVSENTQ